MDRRPIESTAQGVILNVRVIPRAGRSGLAGTRADALLVRLTSPPVEGAANAELLEVLAGLLDVPKRALAIVSGERSRLKRVRVAGTTLEHVAQRLGSSPSS